MTTTEREAVNAGYCRCPNNPTRWYPAGPGCKEMDGADMYIVGELVEARRRFSDKLIRTYNTVADYMADCTATSKPGLPAFANSWD